MQEDSTPPARRQKGWPDRIWLTLAEVARILNVSSTWVYETVVVRREIRSKLFGKRLFRVHRDELQRYIDEHDL